MQKISKFLKESGFDQEEGLDYEFFEKELHPFLVTWVTHNSRVSERMVKFGVRKGAPVLLDENAELSVTKSIYNIVHADKLRVLSYNICRDHVHIVLVCSENELTGIVRKLKSVSAREYHVAMGMTKLRGQAKGASPLVRGKTQNSLWAQKFHRSLIGSDRGLANAMGYVEENRLKHRLSPLTKEASLLVGKMLCPIEEAFTL